MPSTPPPASPTQSFLRAGGQPPAEDSGGGGSKMLALGLPFPSTESPHSKSLGQTQQEQVQLLQTQEQEVWGMVPTPCGGQLAPTKQGVHQEIAQCGAQDGPQEDPGIVGHDSQHHQVAQHHLHHVEQRLPNVVPKPPVGEDGKPHQ